MINHLIQKRPIFSRFDIGSAKSMKIENEISICAYLLKIACSFIIWKRNFDWEQGFTRRGQGREFEESRLSREKKLKIQVSSPSLSRLEFEKVTKNFHVIKIKIKNM